MSCFSGPWPGCSGLSRAMQCSRRALLQAGSLWGMNLALPDLFRARALANQSTAPTFGRAKSVVMLYLHGGHAQQETWDPKPDGPSAVRGAFGAIATTVPGIRLSESLPRTGALMHKLAIIRSCSHANANHVQASVAAMTGHSHPPEAEMRGDFPPSANDFPPFGAVLDSLRPSRSQPTWVQIGPTMRRGNGTLLHGQFPGFLGARHSPLILDQDLRPAHVHLNSVTPDPHVSVLRLAGREGLQEQLDQQRRLFDKTAEASNFDAYHRRALSLLTSSATARAFNIDAEQGSLRDRYGRTRFGQSCLLARRLVEAGVPMLNVHYCQSPDDSWDTHSQHFRRMKDSLCPTFDRAFSALVADLDERGLLRHTLVVVMAEFGRTPQINRSGGRDHWPWVYSIALAGGGIAEGMVHGSSDRAAAHPTSHPHDPRDVAATIYHLLGVSNETLLYDQERRPHRLIAGQKIDAILA